MYEYMWRMGKKLCDSEKANADYFARLFKLQLTTTGIGMQQQQ